MARFRWLLWPPEWERRLESMLYTGTIIMVTAVCCLLAVFWYITPH